MALDCFEKMMKSFFYKYGGFIARHPYPFLLLPLVVAGGLAAGMLFFTKEQNVENLYTPENGQAKTDRSTVEELFAEHHDNDTLVTHLSRLGRVGSAIIRRRDGGNILTQSAMFEILNLHELIMDIRILHNHVEYTFSDLCVKWNNVCNENAILAVFDYDKENIPAIISLTYPLHKTDRNSMTYFIGNGLGLVKFKPNSPNDVFSAEAVQLNYLLRSETSDDDQRSALWEDKYLQVVEAFSSTEFKVTRRVSTSIETELDRASSGIIKDFVITFTILITFSICSCMMWDWVRSKPWLAACGVLSAGLAIVSAFGVMSYIGVPYINVLGSAPFLILGIGLDDMFIMLAAWRRTDVKWTVEQRMRHAFSEAAMSITITSVTDALALAIGTISFFRSVRIFCIYTSVAVIFDYAFQITFFGACMVLTGEREASNRHSMLCLKVKPRNESTSMAYRIFCAGGSFKKHSDKDVDNSTDHIIMLFFKNFYGPVITHWSMVAMTILLFLGYLATAIYGCTQVREGLSLRNIAPDNSYAADFLDEQGVFFSKYSFSVALVFTEPRDVWNPLIQDLMEQTLERMEASPFTYEKDTNLTVSWLRDYLKFLDSINLRNPTQSQFIKVLRETFLQLPAFHRYSLDIVFSDDYKRIQASRFFVTTKDINSTERKRAMMTDLRQVAVDADLPAIAYYPAFVYYDQFPAVLPNTLQNIGIATGAMLIVAMFMIPHPICSVLVTLSIVSIVSGVIGFMALWQVNLDSIAMTNLIICIGFSVDFSAHISYAYISANKGSRRDNVIHALYSLGMPIVQGSLSTILGIIILAFADAYIFRTFFKTMFLVISLGALHGLLFLPVFLKLTVPVKARKMKDANDTRREGRVISYAYESEGGQLPLDSNCQWINHASHQRAPLSINQSMHGEQTTAGYYNANYS